MINKELLIGKLSPFLNKRKILVDNQETVDIIDALINNHHKYMKEYDKIYRYFDGGNVEETAYNVWEFLKDNFKYTIEPEEMQLLRSPAAIIASNLVGIDCKGYATFANGVMDAYRRNTGKDFEIYYRFASYDAFDSTPQHVFSVVKEKNKEYWIDPVLDKFDEKKQPYYYKDKKIKIMALVAMSGIKKVGDIVQDAQGNFVDTETGEYVGTSNYDSNQDFGNPDTSDHGGGFFSSDIFKNILKAAPSIVNAFQGGGQAPPTQKVYNAGGGNYYSPNTGVYNPNAMQQPKSSGISTNTILLVAGAGLAVFLLLKKK